MSRPILSLVAARGRNGVIGRGGELPWRLPSELAQFKAITLGNPVMMGRRTWDSLPRKPLPGRTNFVLSREREFEPPGAVAAEDFTDLLSMAREQATEDGAAEVCVIGGAALYSLAIPAAKRLHLTEVDTDPLGDAWFPPFDEGAWREVEREAHAAVDGDEHPWVYRRLERG